MRLFALPLLALLVIGSGSVPQHAGESAVAHSAKVTQEAGSARFVVSYSGSEHEAGVIDLGNATAVLDRGDIFAADGLYQPIPRRMAAVLGIAEKRWVESRTGGGYSLVDDPFITGTRSFFELLGRANHARALGRGEERGTPVHRYSAKLSMEAFLAELPPFEKETSKPGDGGPTSWRDYLGNYFVWEDGGQSLELAVDSSSRIRRAHLALGLEPVTIELYDYGVRVDVSPPPANQVIWSTEYESLKTEYCSNPERQIEPRKPPCQ